MRTANFEENKSLPSQGCELSRGPAARGVRPAASQPDRKVHLFVTFPAQKTCLSYYFNVFVISHKTELGHHDENKIPLRPAALDFLRNNDFFSPEYGVKSENVFFLDNRREKIKKIK